MNIARVHNVSCRAPLSEDPEKKDTFIHLCYEPSMKASGIDRTRNRKHLSPVQAALRMEHNAELLSPKRTLLPC